MSSDCARGRAVWENDNGESGDKMDVKSVWRKMDHVLEKKVMAAGMSLAHTKR